MYYKEEFKVWHSPYYWVLTYFRNGGVIHHWHFPDTDEGKEQAKAALKREKAKRKRKGEADYLQGLGKNPGVMPAVITGVAGGTAYAVTAHALRRRKRNPMKKKWIYIEDGRGKLLAKAFDIYTPKTSAQIKQAFGARVISKKAEGADFVVLRLYQTKGYIPTTKEKKMRNPAKMTLEKAEKLYGRSIEPAKWGVTAFHTKGGRGELHISLPPNADKELISALDNSLNDQGMIIATRRKRSYWTSTGIVPKRKMVIAASIIRGWHERTGRFYKWNLNPKRRTKMRNPKRPKCYAYYYSPKEDKEYRVEISQYGVSPSWPSDIIWDVARREMRRAYGKPVDAWGFEKSRKLKAKSKKYRNPVSAKSRATEVIQRKLIELKKKGKLRFTIKKTPKHYKLELYVKGEVSPRRYWYFPRTAAGKKAAEQFRRAQQRYIAAGRFKENARRRKKMSIPLSEREIKRLAERKFSKPVRIEGGWGIKRFPDGEIVGRFETRNLAERAIATTYFLRNTGKRTSATRVPGLYIWKSEQDRYWILHELSDVGVAGPWNRKKDALAALKRIKTRMPDVDWMKSESDLRKRERSILADFDRLHIPWPIQAPVRGGPVIRYPK